MTKKELKLLRLYHGLSQREFAKSIGIGESTIAKAEVGIVEMSDFIKSRVLRNYDLNDPPFMSFKERMQSSNIQD